MTTYKKLKKLDQLKNKLVYINKNQINNNNHKFNYKNKNNNNYKIHNKKIKGEESIKYEILMLKKK